MVQNKIQKIIFQTLKYLIVCIVLGFFLFPIIWNISNSFKVNVNIFKWPPQLVFKPQFDAYLKIAGKHNFFRYFMNSVVMAISTTILTSFVGAMAAYGFTIFDFRGRKQLMTASISLKMVPAITLILPLFLILQQMHLVDTHIGLIIAYVAFNLPFSIWLTCGYFRDIPMEMIQAAQIDGASHFRILMTIVLPLAAPGLSAMASLVFFAAWNDYLMASTITRAATRTLPIIISSYISEQEMIWNELAAVATVISIPSILVTVFFQKYLVQGLTYGAVKG